MISLTKSFGNYAHAAAQVHKVFERYSKGSDLSIGLSIGQTDFSAEQASLIIGKDNTNDSIESRRFRYALNPFDIKAALQATDREGRINKPFAGYCTYGVLNEQSALCPKPNGGSSTVDVLVCTPGRLMSHLESTPGFTLQHLRFLVIDEADRLVNQTYQNWIHRVIQASAVGPKNLSANQHTTDHLDPVTWRRDQGDLDPEKNQFINIDRSVCRPVQLRKLLFSATLTKDPRKLAALGLVNPKHFNAHQVQNTSRNIETGEDNLPANVRYSLPVSLKESIVECSAEQKPLVLLSFLLGQDLLDNQNNHRGIVVVFTSSIDSTHRLARLLQLMYAAAGRGKTTSVAEFSSALTQKQRAKLMKQCNEPSASVQRVKVIVCSDGMSRGMDISSVTAVINYDVPSFAKTYVHRCGRTARAGREGRAITIMKGGQVAKFKKMRGLIDNPNNVNNAGIQKSLVKDMVPIYKKCVRTLREVLSAEDNDGLSPIAPLGKEWI
jgi:ATP-dependent RNA helicase DDX51/DBP6